MKIRHPWLIKVASIVGAWLVRGWIATLRYRYYSIGPPTLPAYVGPGERYIFAFWHEHLLLPLYWCASPTAYVLVSQHADGEIMAEVCRRLGYRLIRGSSTRGSIEAIRQMLRAGQQAHLAITPDGPRGPRRQVQAGVIYLAAKTGLPIIPSGIAFQKPWRLRSWDRFALPRPGHRAILITSRPFRVPRVLDAARLEQYRQLLEEELHVLSEQAEVCATQGRPAPGLQAARPKRGDGLGTPHSLPSRLHPQPRQTKVEAARYDETMRQGR